MPSQGIPNILCGFAGKLLLRVIVQEEAMVRIEGLWYTPCLPVVEVASSKFYCFLWSEPGGFAPVTVTHNAVYPNRGEKGKQ